MNCALAALAALIPSLQEARQGAPADHVEDFENRQVMDVVYDGWEPVRSPSHPSYNEIRLREDPRGARSGRHYVRLNTLGGDTAFRMLPARAWAIDPGRSYRLSVWARLSETRANSAAVSIAWLDERLNTLAEDRSTPLARAGSWAETAVEGPRVPAGTRFAAVTLHFAGGDVRGTCDFDLLELRSRPLVEVIPAGRRLPIFDPVEAPRVEVRAPGLTGGGHGLEAVLRTPDGSAICRTGPFDIAAGRAVPIDFPPQAPGYYEIDLRLRCRDGSTARRTSPLVVPNPRASSGGVFGATFNPFTTDYAGAADIMRLGGFRHARVALWDRSSSGRRRAPDPEQMLALLRDIGRSGPAALVGLLAAPPEGIPTESDREAQEHGPLALLAARRGVWGPAFDDAVRNFREHVTHWQLGGERFATAASQPGAEAAIRTAREALSRLSRFSRLGVPVSSPAEIPRGVDFATLVLAEDGSAPAAAGGGIPIFAATELPGGPRLAQTAALLRRLIRIAADGPRAEAVFLPVEASPLGGMLDRDGYPLAPLLAVRAANDVLSGASFRKDLRIFGGSVRAAAFERDGRVAVAAWSEGEEVEIDLDLGPEAEVFPPLGEIRRQRPGERLRIGSMPIFFRNIDVGLVETQLAAGFLDAAPAGADPSARLPLQLDPAPKTLVVRNAFGKGAMADVCLRIDRLPAGWAAHPTSAEADSLEPGRGLEREVLFTLPRDTREGEYEAELSLSFRRDGVSRRIRLKRVVRVEPMIGIEGEVVPAGTPEERRLSIRVRNRADRPAILAARIRIPGLPERMEMLGNVNPEAERRLECAVPDDRPTGASAEVFCEERGGTRFHAVKSIALRPLGP